MWRLLPLNAGLVLLALVTGCSRRDPPEVLVERALQAPNVETREKAVLDLVQCGPPAIEHLRRILKESSSQPVRAAAIDGLAALKDHDSVPTLLNALDDPSPQVRGRAGVAVGTLLGVAFDFRADDPPARRAEKVATMRKTYELWKEQAAAKKRGKLL